MARKMKDSGIEWIGEIPEGWSKNKVIRLFDIIGSGTTPKNITSDFPVVNWIQSGDITGSFMPTCKNVISANLLSQYSALKVYPAPFIIIAMYGASVGNASISLIDGCVNQACCVLSSPSCNLHYAFYVIKSAQSYLVRKAVGGGQPNISQETIKQLWLPLPPLSTQDIIVRNLDATCSKIDDLLSSVHASIEEYKKLKQAVITQAVTKGVRGEREMKPTDFTRWSEIPFDWDLKRVKSCVASISSGLSAVTDDANSEESGKFVLRTSAVSSGFFVPTEVKPVLKSAVNRLICPVEPDTLIVSRMNTASMVGACAYVANNYPNTFLPDKLWKIKFLPSYHTKYMWYALNSVPAKSWFSELATGASSSMQNISINDFTSNYLPIPAFSEQKEIANYLDAKCAEIDGLVAKKEQLVKELESYKKSLIYEVVTGKREV